MKLLNIVLALLLSGVSTVYAHGEVFEARQPGKRDPIKYSYDVVKPKNSQNNVVYIHPETAAVCGNYFKNTNLKQVQGDRIKAPVLPADTRLDWIAFPTAEGAFMYFKGTYLPGKGDCLQDLVVDPAQESDAIQYLSDKEPSNETDIALRSLIFDCFQNIAIH
jgi:hypothetical protein